MKMIWVQALFLVLLIYWTRVLSAACPQHSDNVICFSKPSYMFTFGSICMLLFSLFLIYEHITWDQQAWFHRLYWWKTCFLLFLTEVLWRLLRILLHSAVLMPEAQLPLNVHVKSSNSRTDNKVRKSMYLSTMYHSNSPLISFKLSTSRLKTSTEPLACLVTNICFNSAAKMQDTEAEVTCSPHKQIRHNVQAGQASQMFNMGDKQDLKCVWGQP